MGVALGRLLGTIEFYYLGATCLVALLIAWLYIALVRLSVSVSRLASPATPRAGQPVRVDLTLTNQTRLPTPILRVDDRIDDGPGPTIHLAPIRHGGRSTFAFRLPAQRRGLLALGPLGITVTDPLGLFRSRMVAGSRTTMVVRPQLFDLGSLRASAGHDPTADEQRSQSLSFGGDEFYALRPYIPGDELRRVDWRATARQDELIVRQDEKPKTGRIMVILDRRTGVYDDAGLDRAMAAATSVLHAARRSDEVVRFDTSADGDSIDIRSKADLDRIDERLATLDTTDKASLARTVDKHRRIGTGGTLIVITGIPSDQLSQSIERANRSYDRVIPIVCQSLGSTPPPGCVIFNGTTDFR
ncbi:MAG: DUF58 domain-containing protein [Acidimicrobiales bacterium]